VLLLLLLLLAAAAAAAAVTGQLPSGSVPTKGEK
jgi:hypothetical protein